jgi:SHS2 domain-containing protein
MSPCAIEELAHPAEVGLRVRAAAPAELFACAAKGMFAIIGANPSGRNVRRTVEVESFDAESLLVDWLSELLFLHETTDEVYDQVEITFWAPTRIRAIVAGGLSAAPPLRALKAVTYHGLRLVEQENAWLAEIYFDV